MDFSIPSVLFEGEVIFSEFEAFVLQRLAAILTDKVSALRARLNDLAHAFTGSISQSEFSW